MIGKIKHFKHGIGNLKKSQFRRNTGATLSCAQNLKKIWGKTGKFQIEDIHKARNVITTSTYRLQHT